MAAFGRPHHHLRSTDSTNERARELAEAGAPSGTVVTADEQSAGRGRHGRVWSAPAGAALLYSAVLRPLDERHALLPLAVPLAVCDAIESVAPVSCRVKWPNDVWIERVQGRGGADRGAAARLGGDRGRRERRDRRGRVSRATCAGPRPRSGTASSVAEVREALNEALAARVEEAQDETLAAFRERDALLGREMRWVGAGSDHGDGSGVARGIDERGNLIVETADGERLALGSGEVSLRLE